MSRRSSGKILLQWCVYPAAAQGFRDSFLVHPVDSFAYKQLGNSVSVPV